MDTKFEIFLLTIKLEKLTEATFHPNCMYNLNLDIIEVIQSSKGSKQLKSWIMVFKVFIWSYIYGFY